MSLVLCGLLLTACGFAPRGSVTQSSHVGPILVDAEANVSFADDVKTALLDASFTLTDRRDDASILLKLVNEEQNERVVSVTSDGRVSELELGHVVGMRVDQAVNGDVTPESAAQPFNRVEINREYTYNDIGVLGKENEARTLREEMQRDLVRQIVLRLTARLTPFATP